MHAGRVARCPLSHGEYALRALLRLEKTGQTERRTDGRTDGRMPDRCITLTVRRGQRTSVPCLFCVKAAKLNLHALACPCS